MAFCKNCGARLQEDKKFCASCGQPILTAAAPQAQQQPQQQYRQPSQGADKVKNFVKNTADETVGMDPADIEKNKAMGGLAYFLFFLPLVSCPESRYGRFHANQGLVYLLLCAAGVISNIILSAIFGAIFFQSVYGIRVAGPFWLLTILSLLIWLPIAAAGVIGLINGFSGKAKELPVIGKLRIIR